MRNVISLLFVLLSTANCKTNSYFSGGNDFARKNIRISLIDGSSFDGVTTVQFETGHAHDKYLKVMTEKGEEINILITDIKYFTYNNEYYFPKEVNLDSYEIPYRDRMYTPDVNNLLFLKRLTDENAKLQLYELFRSRSYTADHTDQYDYYISFSNENRFTAWNIRSSKFFPDFENKMSKIVADCPALSEKIKQKEKGYSLAQLSVDERKNQVMKRIVEEYNSCK